MATSRKPVRKRRVKKLTTEQVRADLERQMRASPHIMRYIKDLNRRFGKYAKSPEETRRIMDEALGSQNLSDIVLEMRRGKDY